MTTPLKTASTALALGLALVLVLVAAPASARPDPDHRSGLGALAGAWRMTSLEVGTEDALQPVPYSGQILFTRAGTMSVQAMNPDLDAPDTAYTVDGYEAYYGDVAVDRATSTFTLTVESALARDLIGQQLTRVFDVSRTSLVLTPTDPTEGWRATYERA